MVFGLQPLVWQNDQREKDQRIEPKLNPASEYRPWAENPGQLKNYWTQPPSRNICAKVSLQIIIRFECVYKIAKIFVSKIKKMAKKLMMTHSNVGILSDLRVSVGGDVTSKLN